MASLFTEGKFQGLDASGAPLAGGKLYSYAAGTLTNKATYTTQAGTVANANPVVLDSSGRGSVWLGSGSYRMILKTSADVTVWDTDNVSAAVERADLASTDVSVGAGLVGHNFAVNYAVGTIGAAINDISLNVSQFPWLAACDGVTDDQAAIQACITFAPNGSTILIPGLARCNSSLSIGGKTGLTITGGSRQNGILFGDGAYVGLSFSAASYRCTVREMKLYGTNTTTPAVTLIKATGDSAYLTVRDCDMAYASIAVLLAESYVMKLIGNNYSNCDQYIKGTSSEGSTTDVAMIGETFGASTIGSNALVELQYIQARILGCYWEANQHTKDSLLVSSGTQYFSMTGCQSSDSGRFNFATSNNCVITGNTFVNSYSSNATLRFAGGGNYLVNGNVMVMSSFVASTAGISCSGDRTSVSANVISGYATGISSSGGGSITGNSLVNNTTGINLSTGSAMVVGNDNEFSGNTTDIVNGTTTATAPGSFTATLTDCTTAPTGTARYEVNNGAVTLTLPDLSATSNTTACTITGLPAAIQPDITVNGSAVILLDNGTQYSDQCSVSGGTLTLYRNGSATGFTNSGTKGVRACVVQYRTRNV